MDLALLLARLVLAGVFIVAGIAKLADIRGSIRAMGDFGVPARLATPLGIALPITEIVVAVALVPAASARWGAIAALLLLLTFVAGIGMNLARGNMPDCHCFGQLHSRPAGWPTLIRNGILSSVALFVVVGGWNDPGSSTVAWISDISRLERLILLGNLFMLAMLIFGGWLLFQLLQQNGRVMLRLEALESAAAGGQPLELPTAGAHQPASGLPIGTTAPNFSLANLAGERTSLVDVSAVRTPTLLVFSDPACGPCNALMPAIGTWQRELGDRLAVAVISRGDLEANRSKAGEHGIRNVLLQEGREVAEAYHASATPSAVLIQPDGTIGSLVAAGADAIRRLVATVTSEPTAGIAAIGNADAPIRPNLLGKSMPEVSLTTLDGDEVSLSSHLGQDTALLLWNPGCGYCQRMLDDIKAFELDSTENAPGIVVISAGDAERNRAQGFQSPVLLDQGFSIGRQLGATGTPSAVLIDAQGVVASPVAVGATAILALVGGTRQELAAD